MKIRLRQATLNDISAITNIFKDTIQAINAKDYSSEQIDIWASIAEDTEKWQNRIKKHYFVVAEIGEVIVGWAYLSNGNYFDGLYVHKDHQRKGIASLFLHHFEDKVKKSGHTIICSDVSITALPFFKKYDYRVIRKQKKEFKGLGFYNYIVEKQL